MTIQDHTLWPVKGRADLERGRRMDFDALEASGHLDASVARPVYRWELQSAMHETPHKGLVGIRSYGESPARETGFAMSRWATFGKTIRTVCTPSPAKWIENMDPDKSCPIVGARIFAAIKNDPFSLPRPVAAQVISRRDLDRDLAIATLATALPKHRGSARHDGTRQLSDREFFVRSPETVARITTPTAEEAFNSGLRQILEGYYPIRMAKNPSGPRTAPEMVFLIDEDWLFDFEIAWANQPLDLWDCVCARGGGFIYRDDPELCVL